MFLFKLSIFKNIFFTLHKSALYIGRPSNIIRKVIFHWMTIPTQFPWIKCIPIFFIRLCRLWGKLENHVRNSKYSIRQRWDQLVFQPSIAFKIEFVTNIAEASACCFNNKHLIKYLASKEKLLLIKY